ncbi:hypothetical protein STVA_39930 [Allostella vacuolata]|nr:hypothetical protein STVA_39930 [Stella vacuolata]
MVCHEMTRTGAPLSLCRLVEWLQPRYEIVAASRRNPAGALSEGYRKLGIPIVHEVRAQEFDLILCNTLLAHDVVRDLGHRIPIVWWIHESWIGHSFLPDLAGTSAAFSAAAEIVFVSEFQREVVYRPWVHGRSNVSVVENTSHAPILPVERVRKRRLLEPGVFCVLTVAPVSRPKGHDLLLAAAAHLAREPILFYFVGGMRADMDGIDWASLKNVRWLGERSPAEVLAILREADVKCLPSRDESQSLAILEAMALGIPVVASDLPAVQGYLRHGVDALLAPVGDFRVLAGNIEMIRRDPELAFALARSAQNRYRERFSGDRHYRAMEAVLERAVRRKASAAIAG